MTITAFGLPCETRQTLGDSGRASPRTELPAAKETVAARSSGRRRAMARYIPVILGFLHRGPDVFFLVDSYLYHAGMIEAVRGAAEDSEGSALRRREEGVPVHALVVAGYIH